MILRHREAPSLWVLLLLILAARSEPDEECHKSIGDDKYDFTALKGDHTVSRTRSLPPTNMKDTLRFNICKELSPLGDVDSNDQVCIPPRPWKTLADDLAVLQRDVGLS
jgi:autophagy-related protein 27